ncbi:MAG: hypothetical protein ACI9IP_001176 [Arcticibacterium sp.]|jgi:hypothetical protein
MHLQFQTSDLVPPPYAHAIEVHANPKEGGLEVDFELTYLDRDGLEIEEIIEEGFSENDDLKWSGVLNADWLAYLNELSTSIDLIKKKELRSGEDFWHIEIGNRKGYPLENHLTSIFIQEVQQAAFEAVGRENALNIKIERLSKEGNVSHIFNASFKDRTYSESKNGEKTQHSWNDLNTFLHDVFSGEFRPDQASKRAPNKSGLFLNIGDDLWYELGKSYLIQPSKIQKYLD